MIQQKSCFFFLLPGTFCANAAVFAVWGASVHTVLTLHVIDGENVCQDSFISVHQSVLWVSLPTCEGTQVTLSESDT